MPDTLFDDLKLAFKKLKASVYYDKTQLVFRNKLVEYEGSRFENLEDTFKEIANILMSDNDQVWDEYKNSLLDTIHALTFPKKVQYYDNKTSLSNKTNIDDIVVNEESNEIPIIVERAQYFIDMDVEAQLLGVLWVLKFGKEIEDGFYEHSYGNRLDKKLFNEAFEKFSPYLFKPYYLQYESWRDIGLRYAENFLDNNKDVIILTMDFKQFFYSVDFDESIFKEFYSNHNGKCRSIERINTFVFEVIKTYSAIFDKEIYRNRIFLPIGFLPSNILSNWYLNRFDQEICTRLNPVYYGRYVDDIIIVEKIESNSAVYDIIKNIGNRKEKIIDHLFCNCKNDAECVKEKSIFSKDVKTENDSRSIEYTLNTSLVRSPNAHITVQHEKVKLFYFKHNYSRALLTCFRNTINKNKSEFRYLPDDESIIKGNDYSDIYELSNCDSINKLHGVESIDINKFRLSKYLGKLLKIGNIINDDIELEFVKDINKIFSRQAVIDNYTTWEKVIEYLVLENKYDNLNEFYKMIKEAINKIDSQVLNNSHIIDIKNSMEKYLLSAMCRSFSHNWGSAVKSGIIKIYDKEKYLHLLEYRKNYCRTRMCDKYIMPTIIDALGSDMIDDSKTINLSKYFDFIKHAKNLDLHDYNYQYHPYMIYPDDISISITMDSIQKREQLRCSKAVIALLKTTYPLINAINKGNDNKSDKEYNLLQDIECIEYSKGKCYKGKSNKSVVDTYMVKIGNAKKDSFLIAIANARLFDDDFENALKDHPNMSSERYGNLSTIVKDAVKNKADILVLPEAYVPFQWIKMLSQVSRKNQMAIITGVEHIKSKKKVYNLVATILPYTNQDKDQEYQYSIVLFHTKVHDSPMELDKMSGYRLSKANGNTYDLFVWNDLWFATYCCYELTSIKERSLFMAYADMLAVVEWNMDTNYYSNIIESLSRDIHCYCVQVNSSNYGDSRVTQPSKTETKDILRTKGGINNTVLIGNINIDRLREFQYLDYAHQKRDDAFKPTPPNYDYYIKENVIRNKINGKLWKSIRRKINL
jgi:hypothetical protein